MLFVKRRLILVGAGGQGRAVAEAARTARFRVLGFLDDEKQGKYILGSTAEAGRFARRAGFLLCVGDNAGRRALAKALGPLCYETLVHPTAWVSPAAALGEGTVVLPFAFVGPGAAVGKHCIVNTAAVVEHDCALGDFCHIGPHATLAGGAAVGEGGFVGAAACVKNGLRLAPWCTLGAGGAAVCDLGSGTYVGVPAKRLEEVCKAVHERDLR